MGVDYSVEVECQYCHTLVEFDPTGEDGEDFDYSNESHRLWLIRKYGSIHGILDEFGVDSVEEVDLSCYYVHKCKCGKIVAVSMIY